MAQAHYPISLPPYDERFLISLNFLSSFHLHFAGIEAALQEVKAECEQEAN